MNCIKCHRKLTDKEQQFGNPEQCANCDKQDRIAKDIRIHDAMVEKHNAYTGTGRCSFSCSICIHEGRK
jgi:hypothetical protein